MSQTIEGAIKLAAQKIGVTAEDYRLRTSSGEKHCRICRKWKPRADFNADISRYDRLQSFCRDCKHAGDKARYIPAELRGRKPLGPKPTEGRDGDKIQARLRVNQAVKRGRMPNPNDVACHLCSHTGSDRRHEYHHHKGYGSQNQLEVQSLCTTCHRMVDPTWARRKRNKKGQFYGPAN